MKDQIDYHYPPDEGHKIDDGNFHVWSPSCFWGDQMFHLATAKRFADGKNIIIHSDKEAWAGRTGTWSRMNFDILKFWMTFNFVKGVVFDVSQRSFQLADIFHSMFWVKEMAHMISSSPLVESRTYNIAEDIDFSSLPRFDAGLHFVGRADLAVFQPLSTIHTGPKRFSGPIAWDESVKALLDKGYEIVTVGSAQDEQDAKERYPNLFEKYPIKNLMGKTSMFESIDLLMNHSSFVLSCDSWATWYGIASRKKTAAAVNKDWLAVQTPYEHLSINYHQAFGNEDIYKTCFAGSDNCDTTLANWINENA